MLDYRPENNIGVLVRGPLAQGLLYRDTTPAIRISQILSAHRLTKAAARGKPIFRKWTDWIASSKRLEKQSDPDQLTLYPVSSGLSGRNSRCKTAGSGKSQRGSWQRLSGRRTVHQAKSVLTSSINQRSPRLRMPAGFCLRMFFLRLCFLISFPGIIHRLPCLAASAGFKF